MDASGFGYPLGQIPRMDVLSFEADKHLVDIAKEACAKVLPEIGTHIGRVVSGDQFISDKAVKERISANLMDTVQRWKVQQLHRQHILIKFHLLY